MKKNLIITGLCIFMITALACASRKAQQPEYSENVLPLDAALNEASAYFIERIPSNVNVAMVPFDAPTGRLSDYIFEEFWNHLEDSGKFIMVDRRNLDRIDAEVRHQLESGRVDDKLAVSITKQYGAQTLVFGHFTALGDGPAGIEYRLTVYAADVEKAASSQRAFTIRSDKRLDSLLAASLDEEVERAVSLMAAAVSEKMVIAVGRIGYANTQTVSSLSAWIKNSVILGAQKQRDKFQVASENESADFAVASRGLTVETLSSESPIQAVIIGNYSPLDTGAEVLLYLVSTSGNRPVLASAQFVITAGELERRRLSLLPGNDKTSMTENEFQIKQQTLNPYTGSHNQWVFTINSNVLDGIYFAGDFMSLQVYSEQDCHFRIIHVDVNGNTKVIYPAAVLDNNFIHAGETRNIPDNSKFLMGPPFGEEFILAAAYDQPFSFSSPSAAVPLSEDVITRSLIANSGNQTELSPCATAKFNYTVLPRP